MIIQNKANCGSTRRESGYQVTRKQDTRNQGARTTDDRQIRGSMPLRLWVNLQNKANLRVPILTQLLFVTILIELSLLGGSKEASPISRFPSGESNGGFDNHAPA